MTIADKSQPKPNVLLATQSRLTAKSISKLLQIQFSVIETESAEKAWEMLADDQQYNLMICDLSLVVDTFSLIERIRTAQDSALRIMPILLLNGESDEDTEREVALKEGANDFITLPFSSEELIARVRMHTEISSHQDNNQSDENIDDKVNILQQLKQESYFESRLQQELSFSIRHKSQVSACKVEIYGLSEAEDKFGHSVAHQFIQIFAKILNKTIRKEDTLSYAGQGQFILLYPATNALGAIAAINRVVKATESKTIKIKDASVYIQFCGAIYTCLASESISVDSIQSELDNRLSGALSKGPGEIVTSGHKADTKQKISVDRALSLVEKNEIDELQEHSKELMNRIMPLLEFCDKGLKLGLGKVITSLQERLDKR